jgi:hypothetical protein
MSKNAPSPLEMIDSGDVDRRSNSEPELRPTQQLASFFDLLHGDSHLRALVIEFDAPSDPTMSLDHIALPGFEDGRGVHFPMMNGNTPVRVFVSRAALRGEGAPLADGQYMTRFKAFRDVYEAVARAKIETGAFKAAMAIEIADIAQYLSGRQR